MGQNQCQISVSYLTICLVQIRYDEKTANIGVKHLIELYLDDLLLNYKLEDKFDKLSVTLECN